MFKYLLGLGIILGGFLSERLFSDEGDFIPVSSGVSVGVRGAYIHWEAEKNYSGYTVGPALGIDFRKPNFVYAGGRFFLTYGDSNNDSCPDIRTEIFNLEGRFGYSFGTSFILTPYTGAGIISSNLRLKDEQVVSNRKDQQKLCYRSVFTNIYIPIGILMTYHFSDVFSIGIDYEYMPAVDSFARMAGFKNIRWELNEKGSHNVELPIQFIFPQPRFKRVQYRFTPFFRTYSYGSGKIKCSSNKSANIQSQWAYEIGLKYDVVIF